MTQPRPMAAIELIHKQPVRWTEKKVVSCDGGGGPLGHPRVFINTDKPSIIPCGYCGVPFVRFPQVHIICPILTTPRQTRTTASTSRAFPPHPTLSTLPVTLPPFLDLTSTLSTQRLAPLSLSSRTLAVLLSRDRLFHNVL